MGMHLFRFAALLGLLLFACPAGAQQAVFEGFPRKKITSTFESTNVETLSPEQSVEYSVKIVAHGGKYFWATQGNKELNRSESGAYMTFSAVDCSGYVRCFQPFMYEMMKHLPEEMHRKEIGYVEHLVHQFGAITYYGNKQ